MPYVTGKAGGPNIRSDYYIALKNHGGYDFPTYVLVRYAPQGTEDRPQAPAPSNGFDTNNTPFDRGHVCALELGGPDIPENIVPQWRQWQETGGWRHMESVDIPAHATPGDLLLFQVVWQGDLNFAVTPPQVDSSHYEAYRAETLLPWDDYRIPTRFRVWLVAKAGSPHHAALATGLGSDDKLAGIQNFLSAAPPARFERDQEQMPEEDHAYLEQMQIVQATHEFSEIAERIHAQRIEAEAGAQAKAQRMSRRQADAAAVKLLGEFKRADLLTNMDSAKAKIFQQLLISRFNFDVTESGHFTVSRILAAHGSSYPRKPVKRLRNRPQALDFKKRRGAAKAREKEHARLIALAQDTPGF